MAGSYNHVVDAETGMLYDWEGINGMLECHSGDVFECVEEMYGMIWGLADRLAQEIRGRIPHSITDEEFERIRREAVEEAREGYKQGLSVSPGTGFHLTPEED